MRSPFVPPPYVGSYGLLNRFGLVLVALLAVQSTLAGDIVGTVHARGPNASAANGDGGGSYESRRYKFLERVDYTALRDFVVSIDRVTVAPPADQPAPRAVVMQRDGAFVPHVLPIVAGTIVEWPNADDIFHNVFSVSDICAFDLGLYKRGDSARETRFELPGRVDVFCSIHTRMSCVVLVLPNPWFARTDERNRYVIRDVPAGTYKVRAWHERMPPQVKEIVVPASGDVSLDFVLSLGQPPPS